MGGCHGGPHTPSHASTPTAWNPTAACKRQLQDHPCAGWLLLAESAGGTHHHLCFTFASGACQEGTAVSCVGSGGAFLGWVLGGPHTPTLAQVTNSAQCHMPHLRQDYANSCPAWALGWVGTLHHVEWGNKRWWVPPGDSAGSSQPAHRRSYSCLLQAAAGLCVVETGVWGPQYPPKNPPPGPYTWCSQVLPACKCETQVVLPADSARSSHLSHRQSSGCLLPPTLTLLPLLPAMSPSVSYHMVQGVNQVWPRVASRTGAVRCKMGHLALDWVSTLNRV